MGNRIKKAQSGYQAATTVSSFNERDQLTASGADADNDGILDPSTATVYVYDANGSTTKVTTGSSSKLYLWDQRNRMVGYDANGDDLSFNSTSGSTSGSATAINDAGDARFTYDSDGVRLSRTEVGTSSNTVTEYLQDTNNPTDYSQVLEEKKNGTLDRSYIIGQSVLGQKDSNGIRLFASDGHGSTRTLINPTSSTPVQNYDYDAFGISLWSGASLAQILHTNPLFDPIVDEYVLRDRYYIANVGRFSSFDDFEGNVDDIGSMHKYLYANADPVMHVDPTGNFADFSFGFGSDFRGTPRPRVLDMVRGMVRTMDFSLDGMSLSDAAFELADMHQSTVELQIDAVGQFIHSEFGKVIAAGRFAFAMMDFLQDFVYIDPMQLALGWIGARACFVAGTQVVVGMNSDGSYITRKIEDLQEGDLVLARDQDNAEDDLDSRPIVQVFRKVSQHLRILRIQGDD